MAEDDGAADEDGVYLVEASLEADGAVLTTRRRCSNRNTSSKLDPGRAGARRVGGRPPVELRLAVEAAVRGLVAPAFDPRPQASVERLNAVERAGVEVGEPAFAEGPEPPLDLSLCRWLERLGVD